MSFVSKVAFPRSTLHFWLSVNHYLAENCSDFSFLDSVCVYIYIYTYIYIYIYIYTQYQYDWLIKFQIESILGVVIISIKKSK